MVKHPVGYDIPRLLFYFAAAMALWGISALTATGSDVIDFSTRVLLLAVYGGVVYVAEFRKHGLKGRTA